MFNHRMYLLKTFQFQHLNFKHHHVFIYLFIQFQMYSQYNRTNKSVYYY